MRKVGLSYLALPVLSLASACGGGGTEPATASGCGVIGGTCSNEPATPPPTYAPVVDTTGSTLTNYTTTGAAQYLKEEATGGELYSAEHSPVGDEIKVSYEPRGAVFSVTIPAGGTITTGEARFQDPLHRTAHGGEREPQPSAPVLAGFNYLESLSASASVQPALQTFFYERPGTTTRYVSLAGYIRTGPYDNELALPNERLRGALVFGNQTAEGDVPTSGSASYTGNMLATMALNDVADTDPAGPRTRFEWISGTAKLDVSFGRGTVAATLNGRVLDTPDAFAGLGPITQLNTGAQFTATGTASFDDPGRSFAGKIDSASVGDKSVSIIGSSLDGTFFGPKAAETGGAFRVVGGIPDQRVDIMGAFTGRKQ